MRVLHYVDENHLAWMAPWIQLLKELERNGVDNCVVCKSGGTLADALKAARVENITYDPPAQWAPALAFGLGKILDRVQPDLIHTRLSAAATLIGYWGRKKSIPVLSTFDKYPKAHYYKNSDVLIGCSSAVTAHIKTLKLPHASETVTILNPVLAERYRRDEAVRAKTRQELNVASDETVVLGMGRFVGWKAWDDYLRAIALIPPERKFRFWLIGGGEEERSLHSLARELRIEDRVEFFPYASDVRPWLWAADIFVQTSKEPEGFSLMLIEAMAAGTAPVATNIGGTLDIVRDGQNGLLINICDPRSLATAIVRLADPCFRGECSRGAVDSASEINIEKIGRETVELYRRTLKRLGGHR